MTEHESVKSLNHIGTRQIITERLTLRRFVIDDYKDMFTFASNPEVVKYLSYKPHESPEHTRALLESWVKGYESNQTYNWAIEYEGKLVGSISVVEIDNRCFSCHLGWQLDIPYWNKGIMTEAAKAVVDYLFSNVGFDRISSGCDKRNIGSYKVMEKVGMKHEGTLRRFYHQKDGSVGDKRLYAILKEEWENR